MRKPIHLALAACLPLAASLVHAADPVDVCALLPRADAESLVGKLAAAPEPAKPQGSLLGQCDYFGANGNLSISARPSKEFDQTVKFSTPKGQAPTPAAGVPGKAFTTKYGLMVQPSGKPYFLQVLAYKGTKRDEGLAVAAARKIK